MKGKLRRWAIIAAVSIAVIVPAAIVLTHWMSASSTGSVSMGTPVDNPETAKTPSKSLSLATPYFTTTLPAGFTERRRNETPNSSAIILELVAVSGSQPDRQLAVTVGTVPTGGITALGDHHLRTTDTATYQPFTPDYLPRGATAFQAISGKSSITIFWPHSSKYIELSMSTDSGASQTQLNTDAAQIIASWQWK